MIFEALGDSVVLVELSDEEMKKYSITYDTLSCTDSGTKSAVREILEQARTLASCGGEKVTVEALPAENGGCFFIFTFAGKKKRYRIKNASEHIFLETESLDAVLDLANADKRRVGEKKTCKIFRLENKYYLVLNALHNMKIPVLEEFGTVRRGDDVHLSRIKEHGVFLGGISL